MNTRGKFLQYYDIVNTDVIISAGYINIAGTDEFSGHCTEEIDNNISKGDVMAEDWNFGCKWFGELIAGIRERSVRCAFIRFRHYCKNFN